MYSLPDILGLIAYFIRIVLAAHHTPYFLAEGRRQLDQLHPDVVRLIRIFLEDAGMTHALFQGRDFFPLNGSLLPPEISEWVAASGTSRIYFAQVQRYIIALIATRPNSIAFAEGFGNLPSGYQELINALLPEERRRFGRAVNPKYRQVPFPAIPDDALNWARSVLVQRRPHQNIALPPIAGRAPPPPAPLPGNHFRGFLYEPNTDMPSLSLGTGRGKKTAKKTNERGLAHQPNLPNLNYFQRTLLEALDVLLRNTAPAAWPDHPFNPVYDQQFEELVGGGFRAEEAQLHQWEDQANRHMVNTYRAWHLNRLMVRLRDEPAYRRDHLGAGYNTDLRGVSIPWFPPAWQPDEESDEESGEEGGADGGQGPSAGGSGQGRQDGYDDDLYD